MAKRGVEIVTRFSNIPRINPALRAGAARALNNANMATQGYADPLTPIGPTGFLHTRLVTQNASPGNLTASTTWAMFYAIYQEMGTKRGVKAKKFAAGGSNRAKPLLISEMKAVGGKLA